MGFQNRSDSLPARAHPLISQIEDHISRLRTCDSTSTSSSSSSIANKLTHLQDLHECVDELLLLPLTQQALTYNQNRKFMDELLDGSLRVLDVCNAAKDVLLQTKEYTLELESTIRRKQNGIVIEVKKYLTSRKMAKKTIQKALNNLKGLEKKCNSSFSNDEIGNLIRVLKEVEGITLSVFKSLLCYIYGSPKSQFSKSSRWAVVSKLMIRKRIASGEEEEEGEVTDVNEFAMADSSLECFTGFKYENIEKLHIHLKDLELCIQHLEEGTHNLFRRLIKTRVSLLNIFS